MLFWWIKWQQGASKYLMVAQPLSRYTHVLRAENGRLKDMLHSRFGSLIVHELRLPFIICCRLFGVDSGLFWTLFNTSEHGPSASDSPDGHAWRFDYRNPHKFYLPLPSNHQLGIPSSSIKCCSKCFWYVGYVLSVLKPFLKCFLHVLRRTILGHYLRVNFLRSLVVVMLLVCRYWITRAFTSWSIFQHTKTRNTSSNHGTNGTRLNVTPLHPLTPEIDSWSQT